MKSITNLLAPVALVVLFAASSNAQTQATTKADSSGDGSTPKAQAPAVTPTDRPAATTTPTTSDAKPSAKSTPSRKSRKLPPPPPPTTARHHTRTPKQQKLGAVSDKATDLDAYGRVDSAGKRVGFYPSTRGSSSSGKNQESASRKGQRFKSAPR